MIRFNFIYVKLLTQQIKYIMQFINQPLELVIVIIKMQISDSTEIVIASYLQQIPYCEIVMSLLVHMCVGEVGH